MGGKKFEMPHLDKVIGVTKEQIDQQIKVEKDLTQRFIEFGGEKIEGFEIEKTKKDIKLIDFAQDAVTDYLKKYGREKEIIIPYEHIHLFKEGGVEKYTNGQMEQGAHSSDFGDIIMDRSKSDVDFCLTAFHELFHAKSFNALQITKGETVEERHLESYRSGFSVTSRDGKKIYFYDVNEAIVSLMTDRFFEEYIKKDERFKEELEEMNKKGIEPDTSFRKGTEEILGFIEIVWEMNKDKFKNKKEVIDIFIEAGITGRLMKVGRLIDSTYRPGSFRRLAEATAREIPQ